jgi:hypothetical protein
MPEIAVQRIIQYGIKNLRQNRNAFDDIFEYVKSHPLMSAAYGSAYVDRIWQWFTTEKLPVVQAFLLTPERVPCYSVHLSAESEDESKAAISDFYGDEEEGELGISSFNITIDIGIHGSKTADQVLWMYYILSYILFKTKPLAQELGLEMHTFSATDWQKDSAKMPENIYTRWVKMRCTVFNTWSNDVFVGPFDLEFEVDFERVGETND